MNREIYYYIKYKSPFGNITIASNEKNLIGLWIEKQKYECAGIADRMSENYDIPILNMTKNWLDRYFSGEKPSIEELNLAPIGETPFRKIVSEIMKKIPYGKTTTYGKIAEEAAKIMNKKKISSQAVGGAVGHNPISIIIPCHRVVGTNGSLTGYGGGINLKIKLLKHEGVDMSNFFVPKKSTAM